MRRGLGFVVLVTVGGVLSAGASAGAQVYPPKPPICSVSLSASTVRPDQTFTVTGTQGAADVPVEITFQSTPVVIARTTTNANGAFSVQAKVPAGAEPGTHIVRAGGTASCFTEVRVEAATSPTTSSTRTGVVGPSLAFTGANPAALVWIALVALTVGCALVGAERRQRSRRAAIDRERQMRRIVSSSITR